MSGQKKDSRFPVWLASIDKRGTRCTTCGAACYWGRTNTGSKMLLDADLVDGRFVSHFATCPDADKHRKRTRRPEPPATREEQHPGDATR